jgi:hypothetical protein
MSSLTVLISCARPYIASYDMSSSFLQNCFFKWEYMVKKLIEIRIYESVKLSYMMVDKE